MRSLWRCFIAVVCLATLAACSSTPQNNCAADHIDEQAQVSYVYDGDTVKLTDGRRVRFIGIDTPEVGHGKNPAQAFSHEASAALRELLTSGRAVQLRYDAERLDSHQRTLAHLYLKNGQSVETELLERGLATVLIVPPNVWNLTCYQAAEKRARTAKLGIWSLPHYQPISSEKLPADANGFYIITGRVLNVSKSRHAVWLNLAGKVSLRIGDADLPYFAGQDLEHMENHQVIARGWLHPWSEELVMPLRHPAALEWVN